MCKGIILNGESLYLLCGCYIIARFKGFAKMPMFPKNHLRDIELNYSFAAIWFVPTNHLRDI